MQHMRRKIMVIAVVLVLCFSSMTAFAHDVPDLSRKGSISLCIMYEGKPVPGGSLTLYRVGAIDEYDGNYRFVLTGAFTGSKVDLSDINSADTASQLAYYASANSLKGVTKPIGADGTVKFTDLELGLYLLVQNEIPEGYNGLNSFLVSVPMMENGYYVYDVNASPKVEISKATTPDTPGTPDKTKKPTGNVPTGSILPQTGQLNWPIPVLVIAGLIFFSLGWEMRFGKKREYEE